MKKNNDQQLLKVSCNLATRTHHGLSITDDDAGEIVCNSCGVILEEKTISYDVDSVNSVNKSNNGRDSSSSMNQTSSSSQMTTSSKFIPVSTSIGNNAKSFGTYDHMGKVIPNTTKNTLSRLYKTGQIQRTCSGGRVDQRGLVSAMIKIDSITSKLTLNDSIAQDTALLFKKAQNQRLTKGRTTIGLVAACLYHTCKQAGVPRDMAEISKAVNVDKKTLFRTYSSLVNELELYENKVNEKKQKESGLSKKQTKKKMNYENQLQQEIKNNNNDHDNHTIKETVTTKILITKQRHIKNIPKIASRLQLPQRLHRAAADIILQTDDFTLSGKNPNVVAATTIYMACIQDNRCNDVTQRRVSEASGITEVSIRNVSKIFREIQKEKMIPNQ